MTGENTPFPYACLIGILAQEEIDMNLWEYDLTLVTEDQNEGREHERFLGSIRHNVNAKGCNESNYKPNHSGYPLFGLANGEGTVATHRYAYELFVGPIPEGMCVLHTCDNPRCTLKTHLFLGTHKDNSDDMISKGRKAVLRGQQTGVSKLKEDKVLKIRSLYVAGSITQEKLAVMFLVSQATINNIVNGKTWSHVEGIR